MMQKLLIIFLAFVSLGSTHKVSAVENQKLHYFELAFGREISSLHSFHPSTFSNIVDSHSKSLVDSGSETHFLTCGGHGNATISSDMLFLQFGYDNVQTVYSSKLQDAVCFIVACSQTPLADSVIKLIYSVLDIWMPLPPEVKVSTTLASRITSHPDNNSSLYPIELEITFGLGTSYSKGMLGVSIGDIIDDIKQALLGKSLLGIRVHDLAAPSHKLSMWSKASQEVLGLSGSSLYDICGFQTLEFEEASFNRVHLKDLSPPTSAAHDPSTTSNNPDTSSNIHISDASCLSVLIAVIVHIKGCLLVGEVAKYKPLTLSSNTVIQSGEFSGGKIYHDAGLNGAGVVIGISGVC